MKTLVRRAVRKLGYDISPAMPGLVDFLQHRGVSTVIDAGANEGQFGLWLRRRTYAGRIISFEPLSKPFKILQAHAAKDTNWQVHQLALGAEPGHAAINVSDYSLFSSLKEITSAATKFDPRAAAVSREQITVCRLDDLCLEDIAGSFLKIDTQGFEKDILAGAAKSLSSFCGIQLELPVVHFYKDSWRIGEAMEFMRDKGFVLSQIQPVNFSNQDPVSLVEVDALFRRFDDNMDA
ncbi:MAG: FkbM family methyltransferase [Rhodomicrobium sp.]